MNEEEKQVINILVNNFISKDKIKNKIRELEGLRLYEIQTHNYKEVVSYEYQMDILNELLEDTENEIERIKDD